MLHILPLTTRVFHAGENLAQFIFESVPPTEVREKMIVAVTSKIVSLAENRLVSKDAIDKTTLVRKESDHFLGEIGYGCFLTVKEGLLIPSAGIDESNSETGDYILYPQDPYASAASLWKSLLSEWKLKEFGVLLTDSHTSPLRQGVTGICLSHWGFEPVEDKIGTPDLFARELKMTKINIADALASATVLMMGEGNECRPLAIVHGALCSFSPDGNPRALRMPLREDLYYPLLKSFIPV